MQVKKCDMISCNMIVSGSIQLGPGTVLTVCKKHLEELREELKKDG